MDFITITSETYEEWNKLYGKMSIKYWIDNNNVYWYAYEDICDILELKNQIANKLYNTIVNEEEKCITYDRNNFNNQGDQNEIVREWITSDALRRLIKRNNDRNNLLIKTINNLEVVCDSHDLYEEDEELRIKIDKTIEAVQSRDYEEYFQLINEQRETQTCRDMLHKRGIIDKEKDILKEFIMDAIDRDALEEFVIDENKMDYWLDYDEEYSEPRMTKRKDTPTEEERKILYKRNRQAKVASTCPEWLRDVLS